MTLFHTADGKQSRDSCLNNKFEKQPNILTGIYIVARACELSAESNMEEMFKISRA